MDLKAPILPTSNDQVHRIVKPERSQHPVISWISRILKATLFVGLLYYGWLQLSYLVSTWNNKGQPNAGGHDFRPVHDHHSNLNYTKRELIHFDIAEPPYWPISPSLSIIEALNVCDYSSSWNATGTIKLARGDPEQQYNFMIGMSVAGSSQQVIDSVFWHVGEDNVMGVRCIEFPSIDDQSVGWDATVRVELTIFIKPHTIQFGRFSIDGNVLDIEIDEGVSYENYNMKLFTTQGNIRGKEVDEFTAHAISVVSTNGSITGNWSLPGVIELRTGGWNTLNRPIDINLIPKRWSSGPSTQGVLSATTTGGDIDIRMPLNDHLSLRNTIINIVSDLGSISGTFVTGSITSLRTLSGSIDATLLPYFGLQDTCTLMTSTAAGHTNLRILPPVIDSYYQINPLKNTKSEHSTLGGALKLRYPRQWAGAALGLSETGNVTIEGDRFNTIYQEGHLVVARTDDEIASRLDFSTSTGDGELIVD